MWAGLVLQNRKWLLAGEDVKSRKKVWLSARELQISLSDMPCLLLLRWCDHLPDTYNLGRQDCCKFQGTKTQRWFTHHDTTQTARNNGVPPSVPFIGGRTHCLSFPSCCHAKTPWKAM